MSDWLSELEAWEEREHDEDIIRMARVLRELVVVAKEAKDASEDWVPLRPYLDNLSPDAKELLE